MKLTSILAIYVLFWSMSWFMVLPFRLTQKGQEQAEDVYVEGQAESAPAHFSFKRTALWTTLIAAVLFGLYYASYVNGWVTLDFFDFMDPPASV